MQFSLTSYGVLYQITTPHDDLLMEDVYRYFRALAVAAGYGDALVEQWMPIEPGMPNTRGNTPEIPEG